MTFNGLYLPKKYIPSAKILYTEDFPDITFNYFCENSPNSLCSFWNHNSFFTTQLNYIIYILLTKISHQSANLQIFRCLSWNSSNFSCHFSNKKWVFLQSLDHSSVTWEITLLHSFSWNFKCYWKKQHIKVKILRLVTACIRIYQICHVNFETKSQFFFKLCVTLQCLER